MNLRVRVRERKCSERMYFFKEGGVERMGGNKGVREGRMYEWEF